MPYKYGVWLNNPTFKVGRAYGHQINRYWVVTYKWNESSGRYERIVSDPFVNKDFVIDHFRTIRITKDIPRVEIWYKLKGKRTKLMTYKGLK